MRKLLLYFGNEKNPASIVAQQVKNTWDKIEIPNNYSRIRQFVYNSDFTHYNTIIMLGVKTNSSGITLEKCAHNLYTPNKTKLLNNGKTTLKSTYDIYSFLKNLENDKVKINISENAGTYYCNCAYYWMLHKYPKINILFIHLSDELEVVNFLVSKLNTV